MPSQLERAIDRQRRALAARERPAVAAMQRAYRDALRRLDADLLALTARIEQAIAAGEPIGEAWLRRDARYRRLIAQAEVQFARFGGDARAVLLDAGTVSLAAGAADAAGLLQAVGITVGSANLPVAATERLVAMFAPGSPVSDVLASYGTKARRVIERRLVEGVTGGLNPRQVAREIARELDSPLLRSRLLVLTRTEQLRAYREGSRERYAGHADLLRGVQWYASLGPRTCRACLGMHLREFPVTYRMEAHPACRCCLVPIPRQLRVDVGPTGDEWLRSQPASVQREVLGPAYGAYRDGSVRLGDFVGRRTDARWGTSIHERSARDVVRRAGGTVGRRGGTGGGSGDDASALRTIHYRPNRRSMAQVEQDIADLDVEWLYTFDRRGRQQTRSSGNAENVRYPTTFRTTRGGTRDFRAVHNHPIGRIGDGTFSYPPSMSDIREAINYDLAELIVVSPPYRYRIQRPRLPDGRFGPAWTTPGDEVEEVLDIMLDGRNVGPRPTDDRERTMLWDQTYAAAQHELLCVLHDENVLTYLRERLS